MQHIQNKLLNALHVETSKGITRNGAETFTITESALLDFYAQAGSMRNNKTKALELFKKAYFENNLNAIKVLFYLRDIRGGQGERGLFRICLEWLGTDEQETFNKIIEHVPEYGRWDDIFFDNDKCFDIIKATLAIDKVSDTPSLLAKWLPTINTSSRATKNKAKFIADKLGLTDIGYRKLVRDIRKKIATVEEKMSTNKWSDIDYSTVPSQSSRIYKNAFNKHDEIRYSQFIEKAVTGEVKINAGTLYPYQIYKSVKDNYSPTLDALWNQLPDYTQGKNGLVVADVSGSMSGGPMSVSVSLALYFAEKNKGAFKDHFITFSGNPTLQRIQGTTLKQKLHSIETSAWSQSTNLQAVFTLLINTAMVNKIPQGEMPNTLYIISDMEFDMCIEGGSNFDGIKSIYQANGYVLPSVVFWNVNASGKNLPTRAHENNVALVSGFSPVIFKQAVENKTPYQVMLDTINSERYERIKTN